jgi:hypothetical protein
VAEGFNWYDSNWLNRYLAAKQVVADVAPSRLEEFVRAFDVLRTDPAFKVKDVEGLFGPAQLSEIERVIAAIPMQTLELHEIKQFGRFVVHDNPVFTDMQRGLVGLVSDLVGEAVEPSYNFLSMYTHMGVCEPHLDAPSAKWTLDVCIKQSEPWPIHFSQIIPWPEERVELGAEWQLAIKNDPNLTFEPRSLMPGNAIVFSGSSQWHYRDPLPNPPGKKGFCNLLFFHFIPEGTRDLVRPRKWANLFGIPELEIPQD